MRVAILGDTHVPTREPAIPTWATEELAAADHVVHTGDFDTADALERVREATDGTLTAVAGNMDSRTLELPEVATPTLGGVDAVVVHGTGPRRTYRDRVVAVAEERGARVAIAGHTHEPLDAVVDGVRLLNPGSATGAAPADGATMLVGSAADGDLSVDLVGPGADGG